jgi:hypothetical protein
LAGADDKAVDRTGVCEAAGPAGPAFRPHPESTSRLAVSTAAAFAFDIRRLPSGANPAGMRLRDGAARRMA